MGDIAPARHQQNTTWAEDFQYQKSDDEHGMDRPLLVGLDSLLPVHGEHQLVCIHHQLKQDLAHSSSYLSVLTDPVIRSDFYPITNSGQGL